MLLLYTITACIFRYASTRVSTALARRMQDQPSCGVLACTYIRILNPSPIKAMMVAAGICFHATGWLSGLLCCCDEQFLQVRGRMLVYTPYVQQPRPPRQLLFWARKTSRSSLVNWSWKCPASLSADYLNTTLQADTLAPVHALVLDPRCRV